MPQGPKGSCGNSVRVTARRVVFVVLLLAALVSVATTVGIVISLFVPAFQFFQEVPITDFLFGTTWSPTFANPEFGVRPLVVGTLLITVIASIVALPLGLGSAIYLSEYAGDQRCDARSSRRWRSSPASPRSSTASSP